MQIRFLEPGLKKIGSEIRFVTSTEVLDVGEAEIARYERGKHFVLASDPIEPAASPPPAAPPNDPAPGADPSAQAGGEGDQTGGKGSKGSKGGKGGAGAGE